MLEHYSGILEYPDIVEFIERIITSTLHFVDPQSTVRKFLKIHQGYLQVGDQLIPLDSNKRIRIRCHRQSRPENGSRGN